MTIKECLETQLNRLSEKNRRNAKMGWQAECEILPLAKSMTVDIDFDNDGIDDETQFVIEPYNVAELTSLYQDFCKETGIKSNTVTSITIVKMHEQQAEYVAEDELNER